MSDQVQDADVVEPGTEIVPAPSPAAVFRTEDPMEVMQQTAKVATALKEFVKQQQLTVNIKGRDYLRVDAWQMLGLMLGVTPAKVETRQVENGWEATVELHDRTGRVVGSGEAECLIDERTWKGRDDYARRSMAQTRAIGKAYRNTFGFIATAAGFEATPAEEMPRDEPAPAPKPRAKRPPSDKLTSDELMRVVNAIEANDRTVPDVMAEIKVDALEYLTVDDAKKIHQVLHPTESRFATKPQQAKIRKLAKEKDVSPCDLADMVIAAHEGKTRKWESHEQAEHWLESGLDQLPSARVPLVVGALEKAKGEAAA